MPAFDGTGPAGMGPMTGRGMGYCVLPVTGKKTDIASYGYRGMQGAPISMSNTYTPVLPYNRSQFGMRQNYGWFRLGRGRTPGRGRGRGRSRWFW